MTLVAVPARAPCQMQAATLRRLVFLCVSCSCAFRVPSHLARQTAMAGEAIRLYIGGLPADITSTQLAGRFASFGALSAVELVPRKSVSADGCRGFAYVYFIPKDDQALHRCLSLYNGCKWLGGVLRVEKAKPHFLSRLQTEWDAKPDSEHESQDAACVQESSIQDDPMRIPTPASGFVKRKLMVVKPGAVKRIFAPYKGERLSTLSWDPPPTPPGVRKRKAAEMAAAAFVSQPPVKQQPVMPQQQQATQHDESTVLPGPPVRANDSEHSHPAAPQQHSQEEEEKDEQAEAMDSSSDEGVVDFMSDDDDHDHTHAAGNKGTHGDYNSLSRFDDSDSEEEGRHFQEAPQQTSAAAAPAAAAASTSGATDLSRFDDSDDETPTQAVTVAAVTDLPKLHDGHKDAQRQLRQQVTCSSQQRQTHADGALRQQPAASLAAAPELARFDDSDAEDFKEEPEAIAQPATLSPKAKALVLVTTAGTGASPTPEAASQPPAVLPSSSPSDAPSPLSSQRDTSSSDEAKMHNNSNRQKLGHGKVLLREFQPAQQQHPVLPQKTVSDEHQQHQSLGELSDADSDSEVNSDSTEDSGLEVDSEAGDEAGSYQSQPQPSDHSEAMPGTGALDPSGSDQQDEPSSQDAEPSPDMHERLRVGATPASQQLEMLLGSASQESEDSMQAEVARGPSPTDAPREGLLEEDDAVVSASAGSSGGANIETHSDVAPVYPGTQAPRASFFVGCLAFRVAVFAMCAAVHHLVVLIRVFRIDRKGDGKT